MSASPVAQAPLCATGVSRSPVCLSHLESVSSRLTAGYQTATCAHSLSCSQVAQAQSLACSQIAHVCGQPCGVLALHHQAEPHIVLSQGGAWRRQGCSEVRAPACAMEGAQV